MNKSEILKFIEEGLEDEALKPILMFDKKWRYPHDGDNADSCKMLKLMLETEFRTGTFIFVPSIKNEANSDGKRNEG